MSEGPTVFIKKLSRGFMASFGNFEFTFRKINLLEYLAAIGVRMMPVDDVARLFVDDANDYLRFYKEQPVIAYITNEDNSNTDIKVKISTYCFGISIVDYTMLQKFEDTWRGLVSE